MRKLKYIIGAAVGAVIGYITNWLAIKMLFKPYNEKRVMGMKIPFTPGLIPKEQRRIAKSVGDAVGEHLLTEETITNALSSDTMKQHIRIWVHEKIQLLSQDSEKIKDVLSKLLKDSYNELKTALIIHFKNYIISKLRSEKTVELAEEAIHRKLKGMLSKSSGELILYIEKTGALEKLENNIEDLKDGEGFQHFILNMIKEKGKDLSKSKKSLKDLIPKELWQGMNSYIYNSRYSIASEISIMLKQPDMQRQLSMFLEDSIESNFNPLIAKFISVDMILGKLTGFIEDYLHKEEGAENISSAIISFMDRAADKDIEDIFKEIPEDTMEDIYSLLYDTIRDKALSGEVIHQGLNRIKEDIKEKGSLGDLIKSFSESWIEDINAYIKSSIKELLYSEEIDKAAGYIVEETIKNLEMVEIKSLFQKEQEKIEAYSFDIICNGVNRFIEKEAPSIIKVIDIPAIVEDQINSFQVDYAEKIILDIAHKELNAITWLGALLGGILGILSPILANIY